MVLAWTHGARGVSPMPTLTDHLTSCVFLAPHYDDVVLSCGGTVALAVDRGLPATMVTLFGGEITDETTSDFAREKHARWALDPSVDIVEQRREENRAAAAILGCRTWDLGFPDAIYRGDRYTSNEQIYSGVFVGFEQALIELIVLEIRSLPEWREASTLFVPLAIGGHVDHCIAFAIGRHFARAGSTVYAYEDCPYAIHTPANVDRRLSELDPVLGAPEHVPVSETLGRRLEATAAYATQLANLFRFTDDPARAISDFALRIGGALGPAERFWRVCR